MTEIRKNFVFVFETKDGRTEYFHETYVFTNWSDSHMYVILKEKKEYAKRTGKYLCTYYEEV